MGEPHWALAAPDNLMPHHMAALEFLEPGHHTMGELDDEGAFAAALVFEQLVNGGWVHKLKAISAPGNSYALTDKGRAALSNQGVA